MAFVEGCLGWMISDMGEYSKLFIRGRGSGRGRWDGGYSIDLTHKLVIIMIGFHFTYK